MPVAWKKQTALARIRPKEVAPEKRCEFTI
jgi:hypothetical protein